ncbi:DUF559 domain-containing protein [Herbiconiux sp.]|uniref:endonuclease domain-containing protein n=1 Tax=Herbiconiux sp. TaxID=1871186 RepID=UPI0025C14EFA|nr:DUF559 domain-containing protein [Herbiconiux sp.]
MLRRERVWCLNDSRLHVRVDPSAHNLSSPHDRRVPLGRPERFGIALHRSHRADLPEPEGPVDPFPWALLHSGRISRTELEFLTAHLPAKYRALLDLTDPGAASGLETKARLGLHRYNIPYRSQVQIPGAGRVDILIGDRLVLEVDGREWHSGAAAYGRDRARDLALIECGCLVLRLSYDQVMGEWPRVIAVIRRLVGRQEHRWSPRHVKEGLAVRL